MAPGETHSVSLKLKALAEAIVFSHGHDFGSAHARIIHTLLAVG